MDAEHKPSDVLEALMDPRVVRALEMVLRDQAICRRFQALRTHMIVSDAVQVLAEEFCLSEEHIRTIVYRKRPEGKE